MTTQNTPNENLSSFRKDAMIHVLFGILEYSLILITIFVYISNIVLLIGSILIISGLFLVLNYAIFSRNPYYYISSLGLICITIFPTSIAMVFFIGSTSWSYESVKIFAISVLVIEIPYVFLVIMQVSRNKYIAYYHRRFGIFKHSILTASFYSTKEFDKLDKGG